MNLHKTDSCEAASTLSTTSKVPPSFTSTTEVSGSNPVTCLIGRLYLSGVWGGVKHSRHQTDVTCLKWIGRRDQNCLAILEQYGRLPPMAILQIAINNNYSWILHRCMKEDDLTSIGDCSTSTYHTYRYEIFTQPWKHYHMKLCS